VCFPRQREIADAVLVVIREMRLSLPRRVGYNSYLSRMTVAGSRKIRPTVAFRSVERRWPLKSAVHDEIIDRQVK